MRWIPPGKFTMGSPDSEVGRFEQEGPQHEVTFTRGFWLATTPCTQALWQAVMGSNPSHYRSPKRPVERVSWDDVQGFLTALRERVPGLDADLPTEARWEYACRAGTSTATYAGDLDLRGDNDAPVLDEIAWYGGNSGHHGFDLGDQGYDSSNGPNKQYPHRRAATRKVATRRANPWGLYDMLGNVWEWCADHFDSYDAQPLVNPIPVPHQGPVPRRVYRGGSWSNGARYVRASYRFAYEPDRRYTVLGFRLLVDQGRQDQNEPGQDPGKQGQEQGSGPATPGVPQQRSPSPDAD
jgi:formylglycine-generating enzyme required for sulfatase activity